MHNIGDICHDVRKGSWTYEEDNLLRKCIHKYGEGNWHRVPMRAGLNRCRKSCRLRWVNYLKPNIKRGQFSEDEVDLINRLHKLLGNRWSLIAGRIPGRTANDIKNYWNTHLLKKSPPSSRPPKHPSISNNNICYKNSNFKEYHKKQQTTFATKTTSRNITMQPQVIRPQPWTFPKTSSSVMMKPDPFSMSPPNGSISGPTLGQEEKFDDDDDDDDDGYAKWWENLLVETYEHEKNEEGISLGQFNGPSDGLVSHEPIHSGELDMWPTSDIQVPCSPIYHIWEDDDLWNF